MRLLAILLCALLAACAQPRPAAITELTYASPYPPSHPFSKADLESLASRSDRALAIGWICL